MGQRLTDVSIRRLPVPAKGNRIIYNSDVGGLGVRLTAGGARSFILNYRTRGGRERRLTIGACADWTTTDARIEARRLRHLIDQGGDPLADLEAERGAPTMADLADRFEAEHLPRRRPGTVDHYRRLLVNHIRPHFGRHTKVADVAFTDIDLLHRKMTKSAGPYAANRAVGVLGKMFALAIRWGMRTDNPCRGIEKNTEYGRRRYLSGDELPRLTTALAKCPDQQGANILRVLLLTGCRKSEVLAMRWADVDLTTGTWTKPGTTTKQKRDHVAPLSAPVRQLLSEIHKAQRPLAEFVFPGPGDSGHVVDIKRLWRRICAAAGISGLRIHDLRHSFASQLASGGASLPLIGSLLGHSNPASTHRYAHLFDDPQRAAVEKVGAIITGKASAEILPMKGGRS